MILYRPQWPEFSFKGFQILLSFDDTGKKIGLDCKNGKYERSCRSANQQGYEDEQG